MIKRFVKLTIREENKIDFLHLFNGAKSKILSSRGCRHLELLNDINDTRVYITFSIWDNEEDLNAYRHSHVFQKIWEEAGKYFDAEPEAWSTVHAG